jgi:hypothetical protein
MTLRISRREELCRCAAAGLGASRPTASAPTEGDAARAAYARRLNPQPSRLAHPDGIQRWPAVDSL